MCMLPLRIVVGRLSLSCILLCCIAGSAQAGDEVPRPAPVPGEVIDVEPPRHDRLEPVRRLVRRILGEEPNVDLKLSEPVVAESIHRNFDPSLPVAGLARVRNGGTPFDVMVAIDASGSTREHAGTDVDGDGTAETAWGGDDSVYRAQLVAAASFVRTLATLPHDTRGGLVRVGVVTFSGEDRHRLSGEDADMAIDFANLHRLARRDAQLELPLTDDLAAVESRLRELWDVPPSGMTNVAAGIGRSVIELAADSRWDAERVVLLLSDGRPSLPYDRETAERAAAFAGKLAARHGVRINAFELGENPVTRARNFSLRRMARRTGGRHVGLERPGDVVAALPRTPFAELERVRVRNRTNGAFAQIDGDLAGAFDLEIQLVAGENDLEVEARLVGGETRRERLRVVYVHGLPIPELEARLAAVQRRNRSLIDEVRGALVEEMQEARTRRELRLSVHAPPEPAAVSAAPPAAPAP